MSPPTYLVAFTAVTDACRPTPSQRHAGADLIKEILARHKYATLKQ